MSTNDRTGLKFITAIYCKEHDGVARILIFFDSIGLQHHCDVKYDMRYHKLAHEFIQVILECQQIIFI